MEPDLEIVALENNGVVYLVFDPLVGLRKLKYTNNEFTLEDIKKSKWYIAVKGFDYSEVDPI